MAIHFHANLFGTRLTFYVIAIFILSASYVNGTHQRKTYHNREFNRFEPKKYHSYHVIHDGHSKAAQKNGKSSLVINTMHDIQGYSKMEKTRTMKGKMV